jgi:hypothetical protein
MPYVGESVDGCNLRAPGSRMISQPAAGGMKEELLAQGTFPALRLLCLLESG